MFFVFQKRYAKESHEIDEVYEKTIIVPEHAMGKVIGRGGVRIDNLARKHMCELKMLRQESNCNGDTPLKMESLRGKFCDVLSAEKEIMQIVSKKIFERRLVNVERKIRDHKVFKDDSKVSI